MATFKKFNKDKRPKRNTQSLLFKRKRFCRFTVAGVEEIDYKDVDTLRDFIAENGKIIPGAPDRHPSDLPAPAQHRHQARALPGAGARTATSTASKERRTCKSFCSTRSSTSATSARSSRSRTATPAIS